MLNYKNNIKKMVCIAVVLLSLSGYVIFYNYQTLAYQAMLASDASPLILEIKPNISAKMFVNLLQSHHLIRSRYVLLALIRVRGLSHRLQAGIYQVNQDESALDLLARVVSGDVLFEPFLIVEGSTLFDLKKNLAQSPYLNARDVDFSVIAGNHLTAEGLLLADTYYYTAGSQADSLLNQANQNLLSYLDTVWQARDSGLPYHQAYEMLIAASIIEKEASLPLERRIISGIIAKRLKLKMPLQMDPTVLYALMQENAKTKKEHRIAPLSHDDLKINSPYNTYLHQGLPPTPIAMVGKQSLDAAAHPELTDYLYFFAKGDGTHQFSTTYEDQQEAIHQFKGRAVTP